MARPKNPNSQRSLIEKRREAEQKAKVEAEKLIKMEAELKERDDKAKALEARLAELEAEREQELTERLAEAERERELAEAFQAETEKSFEDSFTRSLMRMRN
jgi:hypothetical protein